MHQQNADLATLLATDLKRNFGLVVLRYQAQIYGFVLRQTGNIHDAEEITQEAFIQAYFAIIDYPVVTLERSGNIEVRRTDHDITIPSRLSQPCM